jgi:ElaB/YqjD/DUF883 family membrane-anchored ribosome-binding protein
MREALKEEIAQELSEAMLNLFRRAGGSRAVTDGERALRRGLDTASRYAGDLAEDARDEGRRLIRYANRELREHPVAAFGAGLAIGALVGMILTHRAHDALDS